MTIYLFNDHTGLILQDNDNKLNLIPNDITGILSISGNKFSIKDGGSIPKIENAAGKTKGVFRTDGGTEYTLDDVWINDAGRFETLIDTKEMAITARVKMNEMEIMLEKIRKEVRMIAGQKHRATVGVISYKNNKGEKI